MATRSGGRRRIVPWERIIWRTVLTLIALFFTVAVNFAVLRTWPSLFFATAELLQRTPVERIANDKDADAAFFKYGGIGNEAADGIPIKIWEALPKVCSKLIGPLPPDVELVGTSQDYRAFGWTFEPQRNTPIGLSRTVIGLGSLGIEQVAINCATCHAQTFRLPGATETEIFVGASSNRLDAQRYVRFIAACAETPGFDTETLIAAMTLTWYERPLYRYLVIPIARGAIRERLGQRFAWTWKRPLWGPGRMSPFNPVKFDYLRQPIDETIDHSDVMPAWNTAQKEQETKDLKRDRTRWHWDSLSTDLREVVINSALGDGATRHGYREDTIDRLMRYLQSLSSPQSPVLRKPALYTRGKEVFLSECASCHEPGGSHYMTIVPRQLIGTDPGRLDMWTVAAKDAYNAYDRNGASPKFPWTLDKFEKNDGYLAQPLQGIWLTGPYLHNGSVASLWDLLKPAAERPKAFVRGLDEIDLENGGYVSPACRPDTYDGPYFCYDTALPGNSNGGHEYGTGLTEAERRALVHYLLTL